MRGCQNLYIIILFFSNQKEQQGLIVAQVLYSFDGWKSSLSLRQSCPFHASLLLFLQVNGKTGQNTMGGFSPRGANGANDALRSNPCFQ